jgi:hypothetical protein
MESFNSRLPDELLNREIFLSLAEAKLSLIFGETSTTSSGLTAVSVGRPQPHSPPT